jgi:hypothetical protein
MEETASVQRKIRLATSPDPDGNPSVSPPTTILQNSIRAPRLIVFLIQIYLLLKDLSLDGILRKYQTRNKAYVLTGLGFDAVFSLEAGTPLSSDEAYVREAAGR